MITTTPPTSADDDGMRAESTSAAEPSNRASAEPTASVTPDAPAPEPRWLDDRESALWRAFLTMRRELDRVVDAQLLRDSGLSAADFAVLVPLSESTSGRLRARDLGAEAGWDRSRLSHQLRRMEQRGLLERTECETDGRGTFVSLTEQGRTAIEGAAPGHVATVRTYLIDDLTAEELAVFTTIAHRVIARTADA